MLAPPRDAGKTAVIPPRRHRHVPRAYGRDPDQVWQLIEHFSPKHKRYRAIATRYDNSRRHFLTAVHLAAIVILLNSPHALVRERFAARFDVPTGRCGIGSKAEAFRTRPRGRCSR
jgi:hypothetical protein